MKAELKTLSGSVTAKVLFIALLILILLIPLGMIEGLILERSHLYATARDGVGQSWGQAQTIGGPIVVVPFAYTRLVNGHAVTVNDELYVLPEQLEVTGNVESRELRRGIYEIPVYTARLRVAGRFAPVVLASEYEDLAIHWEQAAIALPITDARSVREPIVLASGDGTTIFEAGGARVAGFGPLLVAPYAALGLGPLTAPQAFSFSLVLDGTGTLEFLPFGDETRIDAHLGLAFTELRRCLQPERARGAGHRFHRRVARARVSAAVFRRDGGDPKVRRKRPSQPRPSACSSSRPSAYTKRRYARRSTAC